MYFASTSILSALACAVSIAFGFQTPNANSLAVRHGVALNLFKKFTPTTKAVDIAVLKDDIFKAAKGTNNGITASAEKREEIDACIAKIVKQNKVSNISKSPLCDGSWKLLYTTNEGSSAGKLGPFIGTVTQEITFADQFYINNVVLFGGAVKASLDATWDVVGKNLWEVKFGGLVLSVFGLPVVQKSLDSVTGTWRNVYLDEKMRILYAIGGKNTVKENVYVLYKD